MVVRTDENVEISPTVSIGISNFPFDGKEKDELMNYADKALYFAKKMGKNCVAEYNENGCLLVQDEDD